jgi:hypothetical protein
VLEISWFSHTVSGTAVWIRDIYSEKSRMGISGTLYCPKDRLRFSPDKKSVSSKGASLKTNPDLLTPDLKKTLDVAREIFQLFPEMDPGVLIILRLPRRS